MPTAPYPGPAAFHDATGRSIAPGFWYHLRLWPWPEAAGPEKTGLYSCYLWRIEESAGGQLTMVAYGEKKRLRLTEERERELMPISPSTEVLLQDYPVEWGRWLEAGIGIYLSHGSGSDHLVMNTHYKSGHWGGTMEPDPHPRHFWLREYKPAKIREWLNFWLYLHLHPRKSSKTHENQGDEMLRQAVLKFVAGMEKREAAGLSSLPPRRPTRAKGARP